MDNVLTKLELNVLEKPIQGGNTLKIMKDHTLFAATDVVDKWCERQNDGNPENKATINSNKRGTKKLNSTTILGFQVLTVDNNGVLSVIEPNRLVAQTNEITFCKEKSGHNPNGGKRKSRKRNRKSKKSKKSKPRKNRRKSNRRR